MLAHSAGLCLVYGSVARTVNLVRCGLDEYKDFSVGYLNVTRGKYRNVVILKPEAVTVPRYLETVVYSVGLDSYRAEVGVGYGAAAAHD